MFWCVYIKKWIVHQIERKKEMFVKLVNSKSIIDCDENEAVYNQL